MIQDQLVEYISTQLKAGVSAEATKTVLVAAGWQAVDVDDTLKKVQAPQGAATSSTFASTANVRPQAQPQMQAQQPQVIRVSDLVSTSSSPVDASAKKFTVSSMAQPMQVSSPKTDAVMARIATSASGATNIASSNAYAVSPKKSHALATETLLGILMILFGATAAFFFFENMSLSSQISALNGTGTNATSQLSTLQNQLNASSTEFQTEIASATAANAALALNLSFLMVPTGTTVTTTQISSLQGTVSLGTKYVITTPYGVKVSVANSKDTNVIALLKPLIGVTTPAHFAGTYVPGTASITLTSVNDVSTAPAPVMPTSTASTTNAASSSNGLMIPATTTAQ